MARSLLLVATLVPFAAGVIIGGTLALPALAAPQAVATPAPLDLEAIPVKPVTGPLAVQGVGGDDEEDAPRAGTQVDAKDKLLDGKAKGDASEAEGRGDDDGDFDE